MEHLKELFMRFRSSDGRVKLRTATGVSVVVAVLALLVGVLPAFAIPGEQLDADVPPTQVNYGGGNGGCEFVGSAASNELHINNPMSDTYTDGTVTISLTVYESDTLFEFTVLTPGYVVYDVTVNGGSKSNHYDYDAGPGPVAMDEDLHAPAKGNGVLFNLSHINICYDAQQFFCDGTVTNATRLNFGIITEAAAQLVSNSSHPTCVDKEGVFTIDNPILTLEFDGDGTQTAAGRLDITKDFGSTSYADIQYDGGPLAGFEDVLWCDIRSPKAAGDGSEFDDVLASDEYPTLPTMPSGHTACKVFEGENAAGIQYNVIYFEFVDPQFR